MTYTNANANISSNLIMWKCKNFNWLKMCFENEVPGLRFSIAYTMYINNNIESLHNFWTTLNNFGYRKNILQTPKTVKKVTFVSVYSIYQNRLNYNYFSSLNCGADRKYFNCVSVLYSVYHLINNFKNVYYVSAVHSRYHTEWISSLAKHHQRLLYLNDVLIISPFTLIRSNLTW